MLYVPIKAIIVVNISCFDFDYVLFMVVPFHSQILLLLPAHESVNV